MRRFRLGVLASHPIQYQAPLFRALAREADVTVFFAHRQTPDAQAEAGFGVRFDWDVDLLTGYQYQFLQNVARRKGVGTFFGCDTPQIGCEIRRDRFDAVLVMGWYLKSYWQAVWTCRRIGVPVMVRGDSQLSGQRHTFRRLGKALVYPKMLRCFDMCLYVGQRHREYLMHYGVPNHRLMFSPHCVDNDWFWSESNRISRGDARRALGLTDDVRALMFVGKLTQEKRPEDLLRATKLLNSRGKKAVAFFVGDGPLRNCIEEMGKKEGIPFCCLGFRNQTNLPRLYRAADLVVVPSVETWGLVVNEALACGTRVVASDAVGCGPDLLGDSSTGLVYPLGDSVAMAHALEEMLGAETHYEAIRAVIHRYSVQNAVSGVMEGTARISMLRTSCL